MQTTESTKTTPTVQTKATEEKPFFAPISWQQAEGKAFLGGNEAGGNGFFKPRPQPVVQAKLTIGRPGDQYEQEADKMAERVVSQSAVQRQEVQNQIEHIRTFKSPKTSALTKTGDEKGMVRYIFHQSYEDRKLNKKNVNNSLLIVASTEVGKYLLKYFQKKGIVVYVKFYAEKDDYPEWADDKNKPTAGYFKCRGPKLYDIFILAGQPSIAKQSLSGGKSIDLDFSKSIEPKSAEDISYTILHELLHVWFVNQYPDKGTGHSAEVKPEEKAFGVTTYDTKEYDEMFLKKLKEFDEQLKNKIKK